VYSKQLPFARVLDSWYAAQKLMALTKQNLLLSFETKSLGR